MRKPLLALTLLLVFWGCKKDKKVSAPTSGVTTTFTIPADSVKLNPTGNAPLSALVNFNSPISGHTQITVVGQHGVQSNIVQAFTDSSKVHSIPILGLYAGSTNTVNICVIDSKQDSAKSTITIKVGALTTPNLPTSLHVDVVDLVNMQSGFNLVSDFAGYPTPPNVPYMVDSFGDIRWCLDFTNNAKLKNLFYDCGINRLADGNYRFVDAYTETIYEVDVLGKIVNTWSMDGYLFDHDLYEMPNGNFLVTGSKPNSTNSNGTPTIGDYVIEIDRKSGSLVNTWDLKQSLDPYRTALNSNLQDWMHENGLVYDATDNTIILSGRVQGVVKLTIDNKVKWILSNHRGWGKNGSGVDLNQYLLTPLDSLGNKITDTTVLNGWVNGAGFEWNWYQHSPQLIPNGDIMVFDNGDIRNYNPSAPSYSRAVEFKINETNMTVQQVWEYGKERGTETFSRVVSSVNYLQDKNHILFSPGYQVPNTLGAGGKIVEVDYATRKVVFQLSIVTAGGFSHHRVQRMEIYPNGNPY